MSAPPLDEALAVLVDLEQQEATAESAQAARRSLASYKGHVTLKRRLVKSNVDDINEASKADPVNMAVMRDLAENLNRSINEMITAVERYQLAINRYIALGAGNSEAEDPFYKKLEADPTEFLEEVIAESHKAKKVISANKPPPPAQTSTSTGANSSPVKVIKVEKELKPDHKLAEGDSIEIFQRWFSEFRQYFILSNFHEASPDAQRIFLSKCMEEGLWDRLSGTETHEEKANKINPETIQNGIFKHLSHIFGLQDPLLLKRSQLFTFQKFQNQEYEPFSAYMARRNVLKKDTGFYQMTPQEFDLIWAFYGLTDPKLRKKILALENPSYTTFFHEGMKYEALDRKQAIDNRVRQRGNGLDVNSVKGITAEIDAVQTLKNKSNRTDNKFCRKCSTEKPNARFSLCNPCYRKQNHNSSQPRTRASQEAPRRGGGMAGVREAVDHPVDMEAAAAEIGP